MAISITPYTTNNFTGSFNVSSQGYIQGTSQNDPAIRQQLSGGVVASTETYPMWGGIAISELLPTTPLLANGMLGSTLIRATTNSAIGTGITGFTVFDGGYNGIVSAGSTVPLFTQGGSINFYRIGSGAKIAVKIDPALVSLYGLAVNSQVTWDFTNQQIIAYNGTAGALSAKILDIQVGNSKTVTYNTSTGLATWSETGATALIQI